MPSDTLDIDERFKVLRIAQQEYRQASRAERGRILDQLEKLTGLHRKSLIRRLRDPCERTPRRAQRGRTCGAAVDDAIRVIAEAHDYICAERLQPNLVAMAEHPARHGELTLTATLRTLLAQMSVSTLQRTLARREREGQDIGTMGPVCTIMIGRTDDWLKVVAAHDVALDPPCLEWGASPSFSPPTPRPLSPARTSLWTAV